VENVKWIIREPGDADLRGTLRPITTRHRHSPTATTVHWTRTGRRGHDGGLTDGVEGMASRARTRSTTSSDERHSARHSNGPKGRRKPRQDAVNHRRRYDKDVRPTTPLSLSRLSSGTRERRCVSPSDRQLWLTHSILRRHHGQSSDVSPSVSTALF